MTENTEHQNVSVDHAMSLRRELEQNLLGLLREFERQTGLAVSNVYSTAIAYGFVGGEACSRVERVLVDVRL